MWTNHINNTHQCRAIMVAQRLSFLLTECNSLVIIIHLRMVTTSNTMSNKIWWWVVVPSNLLLICIPIILNNTTTKMRVWPVPCHSLLPMSSLALLIMVKTSYIKSSISWISLTSRWVLFHWTFHRHLPCFLPWWWTIKILLWKANCTS
jgi:hypothetical protein